MADIGTHSGPSTSAPFKTPRAAYFTLFVLVMANLFNMLDRSIMSILAQSIKADLHLNDADLGFLLGTAFAVFYSVVGIAMGRISDVVSRRKMLAIGLALWSVMTALGGCATGFLSLSAARIGVGVGESAANPCSHSLLADSFPPRNRALVLGTYLMGTFLGTAAAMIIGGVFIQGWPHLCGALPIAGACHVANWKAALIGVGVPGLGLAAIVLFMREPARHAARTQSVARVALREIGSALPPFTLFSIYRMGGKAALLRNLGLIVLIALAVTGAIWLSHDVAQWVACGLGAYSIATWGQVQSHGDKPLYRLTYGDRTFVYAIAATAVVACIIAGITVWAAPLAMRTFHASAVTIGVGLGLFYVVGSIIGVIAGGWLTDRWKARNPGAPLHVTAITVLGLVPCIVVIVTAKSLTVLFAAYFLQAVFASLWSGGIAALIQDLVLPRMRGAAAACYSLVAIVVASGIGPYWTGKVSEMTGSLAAGILSILVLAPLALAILWVAARQLPSETGDKRRAMAAAAGEPVP